MTSLHLSLYLMRTISASPPSLLPQKLGKPLLPTDAVLSVFFEYHFHPTDNIVSSKDMFLVNILILSRYDLIKEYNFLSRRRMKFGRFALVSSHSDVVFKKYQFTFRRPFGLALSHVGISRDKWSSSEDIWKCKMKVLDCLCNLQRNAWVASS